jgi:hypothetical protein
MTGKAEVERDSFHIAPASDCEKDEFGLRDADPNAATAPPAAGVNARMTAQEKFGIFSFCEFV